MLITLSSSVGKVAEEQIALIDSDYKRTIKRIMDRQPGFIEVSIMMELLKARFSEHKELHPDLEWSEVEHRLRAFPAAIAKDGGKRW